MVFRARSWLRRVFEPASTSCHFKIVFESSNAQVFALSLIAVSKWWVVFLDGCNGSAAITKKTLEVDFDLA